jgi:hypothetical protein
MNIVLVPWMDGHFGRWQGEDQPAVSHVDMRQAEYVAKKHAIGFGVLAVDDRVGASDYRQVASAWSTG